MRGMKSLATVKIDLTGNSMNMKEARSPKKMQFFRASGI